MTTTQFGVHYMLDGYGADPERLHDEMGLTQTLTTVCTEMGMHAITDPVVVTVGEMNSKDPGGVSGFLMIAESHISFHTFPKRGFVTIDVYTCQNTLDTERLKKLFTEQFKLQHCEEHLIPRGISYPSKDIN